MQLDPSSRSPQVLEYFSDDCGIVDAGDDATVALTLWADQHVDAEHAAHEFGPEQVAATSLLGRVGPFVTHGGGQLYGFVAHDLGPQSRGGREDAVVADEIDPWGRDQHREFL
jgi:hypothetical protein